MKHLSCGIFHTLLVGESGRVYSCGGNSFGQLGLGHKKSQSTPIKITYLCNIVKASCGHHSAAFDIDGNLFVWGTGVFGEFLTPYKLTSINSKVIDISLGGCFGACIDINNMLWTWGSNNSGELGVGDYDSRINPFPVVSLQGKKVVKVSCGGSFTVSLGKSCCNDTNRSNDYEQ